MNCVIVTAGWLQQTDKLHIVRVKVPPRGSLEYYHPVGGKRDETDWLSHEQKWFGPAGTLQCRNRILELATISNL